MNRIKLLAIILIAAGILGLLYEKFTYTKESHDIKIGSLEVSVKDQETVNIPTWCGIGAIAVGVVLLVTRRGSA